MKMPRKVQKVVFGTGVQIGHEVRNSLGFKDKYGCELYVHPLGVLIIEKDGTEQVIPAGSMCRQIYLMPKEKDDE